MSDLAAFASMLRVSSHRNGVAIHTYDVVICPSLARTTVEETDEPTDVYTDAIVDDTELEVVDENPTLLDCGADDDL